MQQASRFAHSLFLTSVCLVSSCALPHQSPTSDPLVSYTSPEPIKSSADVTTVTSSDIHPPANLADAPSLPTPLLSNSFDGASEAPPPSFPATNSRLSREDGMELVNQWLAAKPQTFGPPYDTSLASKYLSEPLLGEMLNEIDWLDSNNAFFSYSGQSTKFSSLSIPTENIAILRAYVTETRTLYVNGKVDPSKSSSKTQLYRYTLHRIEDQWKISDRQTISQEDEPLNFDLPAVQAD